MLPTGQVLDGELPLGGVFDGTCRALTDLISYRTHAVEDFLTTEHLKEEEEDLFQPNKDTRELLKLGKE